MVQVPQADALAANSMLGSMIGDRRHTQEEVSLRLAVAFVSALYEKKCCALCTTSRRMLVYAIAEGGHSISYL